MPSMRALSFRSLIDEIERLDPAARERLLGIGRRLDLAIRPVQQLLHEAARSGIVVEHEDA